MEPTSQDLNTLALLAEVDWVHRLARTLVRDIDLAEDAAQDTMLAALKRPPEFVQDRTRLRSWLARVTRNRAARVLRSRRDSMHEAWTEQLSTGEDPGQVAANKMRVHQKLAGAVLSLEEPYRSTMVMHYFDSLTVPEIAKHKNLTAATVRKQLSRGVQQVRGRLDSEFGDRRAWSVALFGVVPQRWFLQLPLFCSGAVLMWKSIAVVVVCIAALWGLGFGPEQFLSVQTRTTDSAFLASAKGSAVDGSAPVVRPAVITERAELVFATADSEMFVCTVVQHDGKPAGNAKVYRWWRDQAFDMAATDQHGVARFEFDANITGVLVTNGDSPPTVLEGPAAPILRVVLERGHEVSGFFTVDGQVPSTAVELDCYPDNSRGYGMLPEHLRTKLRRDPDLRVAAWGATRKFAKGQFRFGGLTEDWTGTISSSSDAFVIQGMNEGELVFGGTLLQLSRPATGLILDLRRIPGFRGRVLWRDTGKAVRGARVLFKLARKTGRQWSAMTDAASDGKFTMTLDEGVILDEARYRLYVEGSVDRGTIALDSEQLQTWNLGDLYVDRAPVTHYLVVDSEGQAIQGAFVEFCSNRVTDASGRGWIAAGKRKSVYVAAVGYRIQRFELTEPGTMEEPFVFRLAVGNSLTVRFMDGRGDEMPYASLMLRSTKNPFMGMTRGINRPFGLHEKIGNSTVISSRSQQDGKWYALLSRGSKAGSGFHLVSMRPGVEVTLQVLDSVGAVITESTVRTPDYGDFEEELWIKTDLAPRTVTLNFVDLSGQPIPTPLVVTLGVAGLERNWIADADGRLEVAGVFSDTTLARFKRDGFVQQIHAEFSLAKSTPTVTLLPGRRMDISVVDADGTPIEVDWLRADLSSPKYVLHSTRLSLGKYRLVDLPSGPIKIVLRRGKQRYEFRRDSSQAEIVLPVR